MNLMRAFRRFSIRRKLTLITMLISGAAMLLACGTFAIYEQAAARRALARDFAMLADMFDDNVAPGLAFHDAVSMGKTLATLSADSRIMAAGVYDRDGTLVARYERAGPSPSFTFPEIESTGQLFGKDRLHTFKNIDLAGETIGGVYLCTDLRQLRAQAWGYVTGVSGLLLGCSAVALLLASWLQRIISRPITELAETAAKVAAGESYDIRAVKHSEDEVGVLIDAFNAMLAQIQARDAKLQRANDELEQRVDARTRELREAQQTAAREHAKFKFIFDAVPVGISLVEPGENATHVVNPAHERITGVPASNSGTAGAFERVSHPEDYARQQELTARFLRGEIDYYSVENRYLRPDGSVIWAVLTSRMFVDPATGRKQSVTTLVDITARKQAEAELAETHQRLLDVSRRAGMAEVATGVLHNVGNVLNSVNVSATLVADRMRESKVSNLDKIAALFRTHEADLPAFLTQDPRGQQIPAYIIVLAERLASERDGALKELEGLRKNIEHIREIVSMQQNYARVAGVVENIGLADLVEDAIRMNATALVRHEVSLVRDFRARPVISTEKHKVLQILVNVIRNAKYACDESRRSDKKVVARIEENADRVTVAITDNGVGIPPENLTRIFGHGFTTRKDGHGFGLHSGVLAARELGGELTAHSDGPGCGATFVLHLPKPQMKSAA